METLITRIRVALSHGLTGPEIAVHFAADGTPEDIWLAYQAAALLDRFDNTTSEEIAS